MSQLRRESGPRLFSTRFKESRAPQEAHNNFTVAALLCWCLLCRDVVMDAPSSICGLVAKAPRQGAKDGARVRILFPFLIL
jgi:hypothetical protein